MKTILIDERDNVIVNAENGHKYARCDIKCGAPVIKYGYSIGTASSSISAGEHVHVHNLKTSLSGEIEYVYSPKSIELPANVLDSPEIMAYRRADGRVGIRNDIWIIPTVGCVNRAAATIAERTGAIAATHPYGCSQLGGDHRTTQLVLRGLALHPNAGGVLIIGLGCENNGIADFKKLLGDYDDKRVRFLVAQECGDEIADGVAIVKELQSLASLDMRLPVPVGELKLGLKCGGSDGFSGITANPLVGKVSDMLVARGGCAVLTEVPEMFGAETILMERCATRALFDKTVRLINDFKEYFTRHGQVIYENPSPGNKDGGISTLEDKALGCTQKGGSAPVVDILNYGDFVTKNGLSLLNGPGNDIVACTNLAAAGCHMILFTTGRGTPLGSLVPTIKISSNTRLSANKPNWIDFDAGGELNGAKLSKTLFEYAVRVANGAQTRNEINGCREIAIFKDGVTL